MVVTTWPWAIDAEAPNNGIGAVGWIRMIPYSTSDPSPRTRFNPVPVADEIIGLLIKNKIKYTANMQKMEN
jgi:hypothetical protein